MSKETITYQCPICSLQNRDMAFILNHVNNDHLEDNDNEDSNCQQQQDPFESEEKENSTIWSKKNTMLLISIIEEHYNEFNSNIKKNIWIKIAGKLNAQSTKKTTYQQCDTKFKTLKKQYKKIKDHNNKSGNSRKWWEYFEVMDNLLRNKPEIQPVATCSSEKGVQLVSENMEEDSEKELEPNTPLKENQKKRKHAESPVERRHREKMMRQDKFLELMSSMLQKM